MAERQIRLREERVTRCPQVSAEATSAGAAPLLPPRRPAVPVWTAAIAAAAQQHVATSWLHCRVGDWQMLMPQVLLAC